MRIQYFLSSVLAVALLLSTSGCGSEWATAGGGVALGMKGKAMLDGIEAALAEYEQGLLERYKQAIEDGARQEVLDKMSSDVAKVQTVQTGVTAGKKLLGVNWTDPAQAGTGIALVATLALQYLTRRKLNRTEAGVAKHMAQSEPDEAKKLFDRIAHRKAA